MANLAESILPGVLPATAGNVILALLTSAPPWLIAVGQAMIVALWCSSAMQRMNRGTVERLTTIEDAIRGLECVKKKRVGAMLGTPIPGPVCPVVEEK